MIVVPLLAVVAACWPTFAALHRLWVDWQLTTYTHGYLIVALVGWLLWRDRKSLEGPTAAASWTRLVPLLGAAGMWLLAVQASIQLVEFAVLPIVLWSAVLAACGWRVARNAAFALGFLWLATPLPDAANSLFQWISIYAVRFALRLCSIPAYFEANHVQISEGAFEIAGGCSGLHFAVVGSAIALLLGELRGDRWRERLQLLVIALALSMLTNWIRIFVIILAGHLTHMQHYLVARSHYTFGWAVFAVMMTVFFLVERRIPVKGRADGGSDGGHPAKPSQLKWHLVVIAVVAMLTAWRLGASRPAADSLRDATLPPGWTTTVATETPWQPHFEGVDEQRLEVLARNGIRGFRYRALYRTQKQGKELDGYNNDPLGGLTVVAEPAGSQDPRLPGVYRVRDSRGRESIVQVAFHVGNRRFTSARDGQIHYAVRGLIHFRAPASVVEVLRVDCESSCSSAIRAMQEFRSQPS